MPDTIKRPTASLQVSFRDADKPAEEWPPEKIKKYNEENPDTPFDPGDPEDPFYGSAPDDTGANVDEGGYCNALSLSAITSCPVAFGAPVFLRLLGLTSASGLVLRSSFGTATLDGAGIPEEITELLEFNDEDTARLSRLPVSGSCSYRWIANSDSAQSQVTFDGTQVKTAYKVTGLLEVFYTSLYIRVKVAGVIRLPDVMDAAVPDAVVPVLVTAKYKTCKTSCSISFQDIAKEEYDQGYSDGYAAGYDDGQADKNSGADYGASYDATVPSGHSVYYGNGYSAGYVRGYNDGYAGDAKDDSTLLVYASLPLRVVDYCTGDPVEGATVYIAGVLRGITNSTGVISLSTVIEGQALKITAPDYVDSDMDMLANDFIPRVQ